MAGANVAAGRDRGSCVRGSSPDAARWCVGRCTHPHLVLLLLAEASAGGRDGLALPGETRHGDDARHTEIRDRARIWQASRRGPRPAAGSVILVRLAANEGDAQRAAPGEVGGGFLGTIGRDGSWYVGGCAQRVAGLAARNASGHAVTVGRGRLAMRAGGGEVSVGY